MGYQLNRPDPAAMERLLTRHPNSPEGAILRLAWLQGLSRAEITDLVWDQVDLDSKTLSCYKPVTEEQIFCQN